MAKKKNRNPDVQMFLNPKSKKPFAYCTKAESDALSVMLQELFSNSRIILK